MVKLSRSNAGQGGTLRSPPTQLNDVGPKTRTEGGVPSLEAVLQSEPDQFIAEFTDIAALNLACARGLPNCCESEFPTYLALLDVIAEAVRNQTERSWRLFKLKPQTFNNSENVFRVYTMEHVFRSLFGVKYDPKVREARASGGPWLTKDSSEIFIHGILSEKRTGTCSSLPTFAIAVGRRLGYPLKLILVPNHTFYRWDDGTEVFNLQPHESGGEVKEDAYFHTWPMKWTREDFEQNARTRAWLHSLTPRQEVSKFLCNRALMLRECQRFDEALQTLDAAQRFSPTNPACKDIRQDVEYRIAGGDGRALMKGDGLKFDSGLGGQFVPLPQTKTAPDQVSGLYTRTAIVSPPPTEQSTKLLDQKPREDREFSEEHFRLVNLINESNRNRSPQHPDGNPPTAPLMRQLTQLLQGRKGH